MKKIILNENKVIKAYKKGLSALKVGILFNVCETTINKILKENNITKRNLRDSHLKKKFNESFFENIDSEKKAYFLGFFYADGCVRENISHLGYNSFTITLSQNSKEPLKQFISAISGKDITISQRKYGENKIHYSVHLNSKKMYDDLVNQGCVPNKSLILQFPKKVPGCLISHFIRGYFDGDGSIYKIQSSVKFSQHTAIYSRCGLAFNGTKEFLIGLRENMGFFGDKSLYKEKRRETNTWVLRVSGHKRIILFYEYFYNNATVFLKRKKQIFESIMEEKGSTTIIGIPKRKPAKRLKIRNKG